MRIDGYARSKSKLQNYSLAIGLVAAATSVRLALDLVIDQTLSFATFYPAVLLAALWGGVGPGILAAVLSALIGWYAFMVPRWTFKMTSFDTYISVLLFFATGMLLVWIASRYRQTLQKLQDEEARRDLLIRELHHRNKNTLAVSQTIINQTLKGEGELARKINGRLAALAAANDVIVSSDDQTARLFDLIHNEVSPYGEGRARLKGPALKLTGQHARSLALVIHELVTNAAKYGALSNASGTVDVLWTFQDGTLKLTWQETGGPEAEEPERVGFGSQLIRGVATSLNGKVETSYTATGLVCTIELQPDVDPNQTTMPAAAIAR